MQSLRAALVLFIIGGLMASFDLYTVVQGDAAHTSLALLTLAVQNAGFPRWCGFLAWCTPVITAGILVCIGRVPKR